MAFLPVMEWLGHITALTLDDPCFSTEFLNLNWVSERVIMEKKVEWRCSRLEEISIPCRLVQLTDVRKFAESRYGGSNGETEERDLTIYWPDNLEYLNISGPRGDADMDIDAGGELYELLDCHEATRQLGLLLVLDYLAVSACR